MIKRSMLGPFSLLIEFSIKKYLSLIYVGLAHNSIPLVTSIISYYFTGEKLKKSDFYMIFVTFICVTLITVRYQSDDKLKAAPPTIAVFGAFLIPFLYAYGNILVFTMTGIHENSVTLFAGMLLYSYLTNSSYSIYIQF